MDGKGSQQEHLAARAGLSPTLARPDDDAPRRPPCSLRQCLFGIGVAVVGVLAMRHGYSASQPAGIVNPAMPEQFFLTRPIAQETGHPIAFGGSEEPPVNAGIPNEPGVLSKAVGHLIDNAGVHKAISAERHHQLPNARQHSAVVKPFLQRATLGERLPVYQEINLTPTQLDDAESLISDSSLWANRLHRQSVANVLAASAETTDPRVAAGGTPRTPDGLTLARQLANPKVKPSFLTWTPTRNDLDRFVEDGNPSVAIMGFAHADGKYVSPDVCILPTQGERPMPSNLRRPLHTVRTQRSMFDAFSRAQRNSPTILVLGSQFYSEDAGGFNYVNLLKQYIERGFAAMVVPFGDGGNATIIAPTSSLPAMHGFAARHQGELHIYCAQPAEPACDRL